MELQNINKTLIDSAAEVRRVCHELPGLARAAAEAERDYQVSKSREILRLKGEGMPVTLIPDIVRGLPSVSDLRFARDIASEKFRTKQKVLSALSGNISAYQSVLRYSAEV